MTSSAEKQRRYRERKKERDSEYAKREIVRVRQYYVPVNELSEAEKVRRRTKCRENMRRRRMGYRRMQVKDTLPLSEADMSPALQKSQLRSDTSTSPTPATPTIHIMRSITKDRPSREELEALNLTQLKKKLKERGIKSTGTKNSLINRLSERYFESRKGVKLPTSKLRYCCVPLCHNHSTAGLKLHRIPTSLKRRATRNQWICKLRQTRVDLPISEATCVCDAHFKPEDIVNGALSDFAVPSIFPSKPVGAEPIPRMNNRAKKITTAYMNTEDKGTHTEVRDQRERNSAIQLTDTNVDPTRGYIHVCPWERCGKLFHEPTHFKRHLLTHIGEKTHVCSDCGKEFSHAYSLNRHRLTHIRAMPHSCSICGQGFTEMKHLKTHFLIHAAGLKPHVCSDCGKGFIEVSSLKHHMLIHTREEPYVCSNCGKRFRDSSNLKNHMQKRKCEQLHTCPHCTQTFSLLDSLYRHIVTHTRDKNFVCSDCGRGFSNFNDLTRHELTHTQDKAHVCSDCGKTFDRVSWLHRHMHTHAGEKPYECSDCGKGLAEMKNVDTHMMVDTGERHHACSAYGKGLNHVCSLNKPIVTHIREKLLVCDECGRRFSELNDLTKHLQSHIDEESQVCVDCGKAFDELNDLNHHMLTHARHAYGDSIDGYLGVVVLNNYDPIQDQVNTGLVSVFSDCQICVNGFALAEDLKKHISSHV